MPKVDDVAWILWRPALRRWATPESRERALAKGWLSQHESGTYMKLTPAGAELFA